MPGLLFLLAGVMGLPQTGEVPPTPVDPVAEAYRVFGEGRVAEEAGDLDAAARAFALAAELDEESAGPLVALASTRARSEDLMGAREAATRAVGRDPDAAEAHRLLGELNLLGFRTSQDPAEAERAIEAFSEAVRVVPDDLRSRSRLARTLAMMQRPEEAEHHLRELVRLAPQAYAEFVLLAELRLRDGDPAQAFDDLAQALRIEPRQPEAREMVDEILRKDHPEFDRGEALVELAELYGKAAADHPEDAGIGIAHADALARLSRGEEAGDAFTRVLAGDPDNAAALWGLSLVRQSQGRLDEAEEALTRLLDQDGASAPARFALSGIHLERCEYDRAAREIESLLELPESAYGSGRRADFLTRRARIQQELGEHREAALSLRKAVAITGERPDSRRLRMLMIEAWLLAGEPEEAARAIAPLVADRPEDLVVAALEARVKAELGDEEGARRLFEELRAKHPDQPGLVHAAVRHHASRQDFASAEALSREWLAGDPGNVAFRFQLGAALERQGRVAEAEVEFRAVLQAVPDHALALNYLGYMMSGSPDQSPDRFEEAEELIRAALETDPRNPSYLDSLGWVLFQRGEVELAGPPLLEAARCMPRNAVVLDHVGDFHRARGDAEAAARYWREALEQDDGDELDEEALHNKIREAIPQPE